MSKKHINKNCFFSSFLFYSLSLFSLSLSLLILQSTFLSVVLSVPFLKMNVCSFIFKLAFRFFLNNLSKPRFYHLEISIFYIKYALCFILFPKFLMHYMWNVQNCCLQFLRNNMRRKSVFSYTWTETFLIFAFRKY